MNLYRLSRRRVGEAQFCLFDCLLFLGGLFVCFVTVSLWSPGWHGTRCIDQAGLKLTELSLPSVDIKGMYASHTWLIIFKTRFLAQAGLNLLSNQE